jgi:transcriptional regulator with GAF, ATPase, and Fis domain
MRTETRWADYTPTAAGRGCLSSLSVPMPATGALTGALNIYSTRPDAFDDPACEIGASFASFVAVAVGNLTRYDTAKREAEGMQSAMHSRSVIEQAKGILMAQQRCSAEVAFNLLIAASQRSNTKLRDVAASIVDNVRDA